MLRKTKIIGGSTLAAAAVVGVAVPAYAASTSAPSATTPSAAAKAPAHHLRHGIGLLGLTPAVIAKDAGTDKAGLQAGRKAGKSLAQIAASHGVSRATLLSRLDATADARMATLINTKLPAGVRGPGPGGAWKNGKAGTARPALPQATPGTSAAKRPAHPGMHGGPRGWAHRHGIGADYKSLASTLKLTPAQLGADLRKGETLQQIATAQKVSTTTLLTALDKDVNAQIVKAVDRVPHAKASSASPSATSPTT